MPQIKDAAVIVTGSVFTLDLTTDYDTKAPNGAKVGIVTPDGAAVVKLTRDELSVLQPVIGDRVVWFVRNVPYSMEGNSGMSTKFVRVVDLGDVDKLASTISSAASA